MEPELSEANVESLYRDLELPLVDVLSDMECTGIKVDANQLQSMSQEFTRRLLKIEEKAYELIGETINLASPKQLAHHFFEKLGYPVIKKTKTGPSIPNTWAMRTANIPLAISPSATIAAGIFPTVFKTFEEPASPVPDENIFTPRRRLMRSARGKAPSIYPTIVAINNIYNSEVTKISPNPTKCTSLKTFLPTH